MKAAKKGRDRNLKIRKREAPNGKRLIGGDVRIIRVVCGWAQRKPYIPSNAH